MSERGLEKTNANSLYCFFSIRGLAVALSGSLSLSFSLSLSLSLILFCSVARMRTRGLSLTCTHTYAYSVHTHAHASTLIPSHSLEHVNVHIHVHEYTQARRMQSALLLKKCFAVSLPPDAFLYQLQNQCTCSCTLSACQETVCIQKRLGP